MVRINFSPELWKLTKGLQQPEECLCRKSGGVSVRTELRGILNWLFSHLPLLSSVVALKTNRL